MIVSDVYDHATRLKSYEMIAEAAAGLTKTPKAVAAE
jgi:hypothetical protein